MGESGTAPGYAFISYVREDAGHVDRLQRALEAVGIAVWRDTASLWPGQNWQARIRHAIADGALVFIACFSRHSASRPVTYQDEELALAVEQLHVRGPDQEWLIPVRFEECQIPERDIGGRPLASVHSADLFGPDEDIATIRLVVAVLRILDRQAGAARPGRPRHPAETLTEPGSRHPGPATPHPGLSAAPDDALSPLRFGDGDAVTIACAETPRSILERMPYADAGKPDYIGLLRYSDLDALLEMHAHIRALNPANPVRYCTPGELSSEDYQSHLIAIGGIDWNALTRIILDSPALPVRQVADWTTRTGVYFEVDDNGTKTQHRAVLRNIQDEATLSEDVALFARCSSPFSRHRTVTICCAMYAPGTTGAVLALTDKTVRARNIEFLRSRFGDSKAYFVLTRISVIHGRAVPPDWTIENNVHCTWPQPRA